MVVQKVPRKSRLGCRKCHACHAKDRGATSVLLRRQASADIYGGAESPTPATQKTAAPHQSYFVAKLPLTSMVVQKVPRLPRKSSLRCRKCHACQSYFVAKLPLTSMVVQKVPRLPRKSSLRCRKCHACHAKDRGATSVLLRRQASADIYGGTESTTPATQIEPEVPKVPRKRPRRHISPTSSPSFR